LDLLPDQIEEKLKNLENFFVSGKTADYRFMAEKVFYFAQTGVFFENCSILIHVHALFRYIFMLHFLPVLV